jgi:hypothetical protein
MMFARTYPHYHPRKGEPTHFVEKIWKSLYSNGACPAELDKFIQHYEAQVRGEYAKYNEIHRKGHTIRAGNRWWVGDYFIPRVWSGKPYRSKTIQFAPPIIVEKVWEIVICKDEYLLNGMAIDLPLLTEIAKNDGLSADDMELWFAPYGKKEPAICQIICWNPLIEY